MQRRNLSDILRAGNGDTLRKLWETTDAAGDFAPLPAGEYVAHVTAAELFNSRTNATPGVKLTFKICEGEHAGRLVWHDCWLTEAALPQTKRDLLKLGISSLELLDRPLPRGIRCRVRVTLRMADDGTQHNRVRSFDVVGIDAPEADPFAPTEDGNPSETEGGPSA